MSFIIGNNTLVSGSNNVDIPDQYTNIPEVSIPESGTVIIGEGPDGKKKKFKNQNIGATATEDVSRTVLFDPITHPNGAAINASIRARIGNHLLGGAIIDLDFKDGGGSVKTYDMSDEPLDLSRFEGAGHLRILGDDTETGANTRHFNQNVRFDGSGAAHNVFIVKNNQIRISINNCRIALNSVGGRIGLDILESRRVTSAFNYYLGNGTADGDGIRCGQGGYGQSALDFVENMENGLTSSDAGILTVSGTDERGTIPIFGLKAVHGFIIKKAAPYPDGSTADNISSSGGILSLDSGVILGTGP